MFPSIESLAHDLHQVTSWHPENQPCTESDLTQIVQAAINMPTSRDDLRGTAIWIPHRSGDATKFRDSVLRTCKRAIDWTYNHCHTSIVFLLHQGTTPDNDPDVFVPWKLRTKWWGKCRERLFSDQTAFGKQVPIWLMDQIVSHTIQVSAAGLEARRLGYHVQFVTMSMALERAYTEAMWNNFPDIVAGNYIPMHCLNIGTRPLRVKLSDRRNRMWQWVTDQDHIIRPDLVPQDRPFHYEKTDVIMNCQDQNQFRGTYKPLP